ncbi:MAG TPA: ABC transporter ATP-binding protein [Treponema sp.]|nr:ABC transporter ATP-binding protein [Treponema sp.]
MLELHDLQVYYGGIHALQGISLDVPDGKIVTLIGANGAGKSSTLNSIVGLVKPRSGSIKWNGEELTGLTTKQIVSQGIVLVPEGRRIFPNLSVWENLTLGAYHRDDKAEIEKDREMVYDLFPRLKERLKQSAGTLSGGEQQMLAVGRGLMSRPKLFMLDEPSLGLAPLIVKDIFDIILKINAQGTTVLLVEQNARAALKIADYGYVMETGRITLSGTGKELLNDERIRHAYLGGNSQSK